MNRDKFIMKIKLFFLVYVFFVMNGVGMAYLASKFITKQEHRDAIIPCVEKAKAAIAAAKKA